jgi:signal peptidase I
MKPFRVVGTSMWPVLKDGDLVLTQNKKELERGDLVVRLVGDSPTVHRFLAPGVTKGDWSAFPDEPGDFVSSGDAVIGIVPRGLATRKIAPARPRPRFLLRWQARLSEIPSQNMITRKVFRLGLVCNGLLLRGLYYQPQQESLNVVSEQ